MARRAIAAADADRATAAPAKSSSRPDEPDRLVALEQIEQVAQRLAASRRQRRIARQHQLGVVAGRADQAAVHLDAGDAEARHARLPRAEHVAFAAQPQILFGDAEAVLGLAHDLEPRLGGVAERRPVEQQTGRAAGAPADTSAQLVQLVAKSNATLAETFTPETIAFIKERIDSQVPPIVHHLADIATSENTRKTIGALIKREVDDYYEQLSLIKKIFISRERIYREVDELVNKSLPSRIEEYLRGPAFEQEAEAFLNATIDNVLSRPLSELIGQIESEKFDAIKREIADRILEMARSEELSESLSAYVGDCV